MFSVHFHGTGIGYSLKKIGRYFLVKVAKKSIQTEMLWENKELTMAKKLIKNIFNIHP